MKETVLEVENLTKSYLSFRAVNGISFRVPRGKVIGLLGPNGAGKTTTIHMLLGVTLPDKGAIRYFGQDFFRNKESSLQRINFASSFNTLQGRISVKENLLVFAKLYGVREAESRIMELAEIFEIREILPQRFWDLSSGQKTRVNLVKSLINEPELLLMDEPTASLDPDIADKTLSFIEQLKKSSEITILYTSHNMDEVARICDEVVFLDRGRIVAHDTPLGLTKRIKSATLRLTFDGEKRKVERYLKTRKQPFSFVKEHVVSISTKEKLIPKLIFGVSQAGIWITDIEVKKPTLEDVFLQIARRKHAAP